MSVHPREDGPTPTPDRLDNNLNAPLSEPPEPGPSEPKKRRLNTEDAQVDKATAHADEEAELAQTTAELEKLFREGTAALPEPASDRWIGTMTPLLLETYHERLDMTALLRRVFNADSTTWEQLGHLRSTPGDLLVSAEGDVWGKLKLPESFLKKALQYLEGCRATQCESRAGVRHVIFSLLTVVVHECFLNRFHCLPEIPLDWPAGDVPLAGVRAGQTSSLPLILEVVEGRSESQWLPRLFLKILLIWMRGSQRCHILPSVFALVFSTQSIEVFEVNFIAEGLPVITRYGKRPLPLATLRGPKVDRSEVLNHHRDWIRILELMTATMAQAAASTAYALWFYHCWVTQMFYPTPSLVSSSAPAADAADPPDPVAAYLLAMKQALKARRQRAKVLSASLGRVNKSLDLLAARIATGSRSSSGLSNMTQDDREALWQSGARGRAERTEIMRELKGMAMWPAEGTGAPPSDIDLGVDPAISASATSAEKARQDERLWRRLKLGYEDFVKDMLVEGKFVSLDKDKREEMMDRLKGLDQLSVPACCIA